MPENTRKPVVPGNFNKPVWFRTRTAEYGPDMKSGEGSALVVTTEVFLDGERIGSITGIPVPGRAIKTWTANRIHPGVKQHGTARFNAVDAVVRTHLTDLQQHPIAHLSAA
jgi:hypothetical protein